MGQFVTKYGSGKNGKGYLPGIREIPGSIIRVEPIDPADPVYKGKFGGEHPSPQREHPSPQREHPSPQRIQSKN